jgi:DNA-binding protein H-NS
LTQDDLFGRQAAAKGRPARAAGAKYSDGKGGEWVGRGPRPRWLREALAAGRSLDDFALGGRGTASAAKPGAKKPARKGSKSAKYSDGAGNTWSGFGRKPKWMVEAIASGRKQEDLLARS